MMNRNQEYWQEKASLMIEDYVPELQEVMPKAELKQLTNHIGIVAEKHYRNLLSTMQTDIQTEMTARELTEQMMQTMLYQKSEELQPQQEDEEEYSEKEKKPFICGQPILEEVTTTPEEREKLYEPEKRCLEKLRKKKSNEQTLSDIRETKIQK